MNNSTNSIDQEYLEDYNENIQLAENISVDDDSDQGQSSEEKRELLKKTKIVRQTWSIQEIFQKIRDKRLDLSPDYQRNVIWKTDKQTAFIESLFMGIIVPPIYVVEIPGRNPLDNSTYEVVDGKQRLTTIEVFLNGKLKLDKKSLEYYRDWFGGKLFCEILSNYQELTYEMLSSVLDIYVITANSPEFTKYDIFSRLNKGAEKLKVNEIRRAIYRSDILDSIDVFVKSNINSEDEERKRRYKGVFTTNDIKRYDDYGRFYTSLAFYLQSDTESCVVNGYNSRPRDMINKVLQQIQNNEIHIENDDLMKLLERTILLMDYLKEVDGRDYIINSCIPFVTEKWELLESSIQMIINDTLVKESIMKSPSTTSNVNNRLRRIKSILNSPQDE